MRKEGETFSLRLHCNGNNTAEHIDDEGYETAHNPNVPRWYARRAAWMRRNTSFGDI